MLKSIVESKRALFAVFGLAFAGLALLGIAIPVSAQELETFDPDVAFEEAAPTPGEVREVQDRATNAIGAGATQARDTVNSAIDSAASAPDFVNEGAFRSARELDPATGQPIASRDMPTTWSDANQAPPAWNDSGDVAVGTPQYSDPQPAGPVPQWVDPQQGQAFANVADEQSTFAQDDLIGAAEGVFGKGAKGLAGMIEDLLKKQGQPNGYIVGREAGGAFIFGARYGSGTLYHKVEGERKVYWTGPSLGFDAGANAGNTFVLVYNLFDTEDLFKRYPAGEGQAYLVGGLHASYVRRGDVVLIPIRMGAGLRLGVNAGYMRFSKKHRWLPF